MIQERGYRQCFLRIACRLALLLACPLLGYSASSDPEQEIRRSLGKITKVYQMLETHLADPLDPEQTLYEGAIRGTLSRLDPFSVFLDEQQFAMFQQQQRGVQQGFGAILNVQSGSVMVLQAIPGAPFSRAGLGPGDRITRINRHWVAAMDLQQLVEALQEARSGRVRLSVIRSGKVVAEEFDLDPTEVPQPSVDKKFLLLPQVGYLHVAGIEQGTLREITLALEQWKQQQLQGLILDLRDNPGGALEAAVEIAGLFLEKGQLVTSLQGRAMPEKKYVVASSPPWPDLPLVVLVNEATASAAEIIAAALQEHDRAWLVGTETFGKGVVESVLPLSQGAALVLTVAQYFTPHGASVQKALPGTALAGILGKGTRQFFSDQGRPLGRNGGVKPDEMAVSWQLDSWARFLQQGSAFINFAQAYLDRHGKVEENFLVDETVLEDFRNFLRRAGVRVPPESWERFQPFLRTRIHTELFNLTFGMTRGDEIEIQADPQVQAGLLSLSKASQLLAGRSQARSGQ
ncbi:MAG: PDZ domain-containing protein [Acidobacteria bacterium]|nr:PDZ domain-containing protein [Acidobacteriota bacterium]